MVHLGFNVGLKVIKKISDIVEKVISFVFVLYFLGTVVAVPYFNWQIAKKEGFASWLVLGQVKQQFSL